MEELLLRYCTDEATEEENAQVEAWLQESEENRKLLQQVHLLSIAVAMEENPSQKQVEKALDKVHGRMLIGRYKKLGRMFQRVAAVLVLPLLGLVALLYMELHRETTRMLVVRTNPGMNTTVVLPDSSTVVLNSSSCLKYPERFTDDCREVTLVGEGYFAVRKDADSRFVVHTPNNSAIEVHGTEFNVSAYLEEHEVSTTLVSGKVSFSYSDSCKQGTVMMEPGQKLVYAVNAKDIDLRNVNVDVETAWKDGKLIFRKTPFEDILKMLGRRYNVKFILKNEALKKHSFTGEFMGQYLPRVLEKFSLSSDITFKFVENADANEEKQIVEVY